VGQDGQRSRYDSENKFTYLDRLCCNLIRGAAKSAIQKWAAEQQDVLEAEFLRQLQTKKVRSTVVRACVDGLASATKNHWRFTVDFPE